MLPNYVGSMYQRNTGREIHQDEQNDIPFGIANQPIDQRIVVRSNQQSISFEGEDEFDVDYNGIDMEESKHPNENGGNGQAEKKVPSF